MKDVIELAVNQKKYNIGLDIGTNSVGWAVVEINNQKVMKKGGKALWGVRLFTEANTAEKRRNYRSTRRRYDRRRERIKILQEEFKDEIFNIDKNFYQKLKGSFYSPNDLYNKKISLTEEDKINIFSNNKRNNNNNFIEKKYPTIYHLRNDLINSKEKKDIRLIYLAMHHIIKYRGNFIYEDMSFKVNDLNINKKLEEVLISYDNIIHISETYNDLTLLNYEKLSEILLLNSKKDMEQGLENELKNYRKEFVKEFIKMITGCEFSPIKLFLLTDTKSKLKLNFKKDDLETKLEEDNLSGEYVELLYQFKELYNMVFLKKILQGKGNKSTNISSIMVNIYEQHKQDLKDLKKLFKPYKEYYRKLFKNDCDYKKYIDNKITQEDFCKNISSYYKKIIENSEKNKSELINFYNETFKNRLENFTFMPRITEPNNGIFPYQLNEEELIRIIENQKKYYSFLGKKIENEYKLVKLLKFKIPYYVGPLVSEEKSKFAWMERNIEDEKINPYNFDRVVNKDLTAEKFIKRMISTCTYLIGEPALPNNSILYNRFKVLNELKQIKINDQKINIEQQEKIIRELFETTSGTITEKKFINYLKQTGDWDMYDTLNITGYSSDKKFANNMQSFIDFFGTNGIFENTNYTEEDAEIIIEWITIFKDKKILERKIKTKYPDLTNNMQKILNKSYNGWGNLSKKLLTTCYYKDKETEIYKSIIDIMKETKENFMQVLNNDEYKFQNMIKKINKEKNKEKDYREIVSELATSPAVKRGIYQALGIVEEIVNYLGYEPEYISIEMARSNDKKIRTKDRKQQLIDLYKKNKKEIDNYNNLMKQLNKSTIDSDKLFLYFLQESKCIYCQKNIDNLDECEIDHIIPRTLIKDDSLDNRVLVHKECNQTKASSFIVPSYFRNENNKIWWNHLKKLELISNKKFYNLCRNKYSDEDIKGFINRQLVETRQITKHVANILENIYKSKVIYLKSGISINYRNKYELYKFREINDYHHAHDAYLSAVLGEYKEKYLKSDIDYGYIKYLDEEARKLNTKENYKYGYVINSLNKNLINDETGEVIFNANDFNKQVENTLYRNDILVSFKTEIKDGIFYKEKILPKGTNGMKIKSNLPTEYYGAYSGVNISYFILVEYKNKRKIIGIPIILTKSKDKNAIDIFIKEQTNCSEYIIIKDKIPFNTLINFKGQLVIIKGYSIAKKNSEVSNAVELKISKNLQIKWKYTLNRLLNNKTSSEDDNNYKKNLIEFLYYLLQSKRLYPLFENEINLIEEVVKSNILTFNLEELEKVIKELLVIYNCTSENGNLSQFELKDRIGRLSGKALTEGKITYKSITGIKEKTYEF